MRKNTARHWLHAGLDLLPIILIPVFMIYSHRHDLSTDITIQQDVYKDFYQQVINGKPDNLDHISIDTGLTADIYNGYLDLVSSEPDLFGTQFECNFDYAVNDILYISLTVHNEYDLPVSVYFNEGNLLIFEDEVFDNKKSILWSDTNTYTFLDLDIYVDFTDDDSISLKDFQCFNLTTIFGTGNEPTIEVFESYLTQDYYDFGNNQVKVGIIDVPAKNNDIMSVFMDSFNNSISKYFNMGNVFGMTNVYQWFNTNIFNGQAPTIIFSVWNIVLYEFVMDLLFLLYALFMWFIDVTKRLIEKPLDSIK